MMQIYKNLIMKIIPVNLMNLIKIVFLYIFKKVILIWERLLDFNYL